MLPAAILERFQKPELRSLEEIEAYVAERAKEVDELLAYCELQIEALGKKITPGARELRQWYLGAHRGLELAKAAWSMWTKTDPRQ